jgi:hypothetical protein
MLLKIGEVREQRKDFTIADGILHDLPIYSSISNQRVLQVVGRNVELAHLTRASQDLIPVAIAREGADNLREACLELIPSEPPVSVLITRGQRRLDARTHVQYFLQVFYELQRRATAHWARWPRRARNRMKLGSVKATLETLGT